jgi:phosphorylcholine metabolism protein LicD
MFDINILYKINQLKNLDVSPRYFEDYIIDDPEKAKNVLFDIVDAFELYGVNYRVVFGTLLGIYRDGQIIKGDHDMDLAVLESDADKIYKAINFLIKTKNFKLFFVHQLAFKVLKNNVYCDIFVFDKNYEYKWDNRWYFKLFEDDFKKNNIIEFDNKKLKTVYDIEKFLVTYYGKDWKTPANRGAWFNHY